MVGTPILSMISTKTLSKMSWWSICTPLTLLFCPIFNVGFQLKCLQRLVTHCNSRYIMKRTKNKKCVDTPVRPKVWIWLFQMSITANLKCIVFLFQDIPKERDERSSSNSSLPAASDTGGPNSGEEAEVSSNQSSVSQTLKNYRGNITKLQNYRG